MAFSFLESKYGNCLRTLSAIIGVGIFVRGYFLLSTSRAEYITHLTISIILLLLFFGSIVREYQTARKEKYANINDHKHRCIHLSRDLLTYLQENNKTSEPETVRSMGRMILQQILTELAGMYSQLTGTSCRATLKTVYEHSGQLYVYALQRDGKSADQCKEDDQERLVGHMDPIGDNEDFDLLHRKFGSKMNCFFCNDLTTKRNYRTSSYKVYGSPSENIGLVDRALRFIRMEKEWPLPYRSSIVWPVQQRNNAVLPLKQEGCIGFLAIDSESRHVFRKKWDVPIGALVADALFHPLKQYAELPQPPIGGSSNAGKN